MPALGAHALPCPHYAVRGQRGSVPGEQRGDIHAELARAVIEHGHRKIAASRLVFEISRLVHAGGFGDLGGSEVEHLAEAFEPLCNLSGVGICHIISSENASATFSRDFSIPAPSSQPLACAQSRDAAGSAARRRPSILRLSRVYMPFRAHETLFSAVQ